MTPKFVRSCFLLAPFAMYFLAACGTEQPAAVSTSSSLRSPVFDAEFRKQWDDGASETTTYDTLRLRGGVLRKGTATAITRRVNYSEDERVPVEGAKSAANDLFPVMQMSWIERYTEGLNQCAEMTTSVLALSSVNGRFTGEETKVDFSLQSWDGQLFHQLLFDATGVRSHQYSYLESEGDEQITLAYPRDGISGDALWFWARHMATPAMKAGEQKRVLVLPALRDARSQHHALTWKRASLKRPSEQKLFAGKMLDAFFVTDEDGRGETFLVQPQAPFRVMHWENTAGEHVDFVSDARLKSWDSVTPSAKQ